MSADRHLDRAADELRERLAGEGWHPNRIAAAIVEQVPPVSQLKAHRLARGWTGAKAVTKLGELYEVQGLKAPPSLTPARLSEWERPASTRRPGPDLLDALCRLYETRPDRLGFGRDYTNPAERPAPQAAAVETDTSHLRGYAGRATELSSPVETGLVPSALAVPLGRGAPDRPDQEARPTDRRQLLRSVTALGAAIVTQAAAASAAASRRVAASNVDPMTLEELDQDVERFAHEFPSTPHADLFPEVWTDWLRVEQLLDGRHSLKDRAHLTLLAGQLTYFLGRLSFNLGDYAAARKQAVLAWQHAHDVRQAVLCASVRGLQCSIASFANQPARAVTFAEAARPYLTPYTASRMAAYEARAHAILGDQRSAESALARLERSQVDLPVQPGSSPFTSATAMMFLAGTHARLGQGEIAEGYARQALAQYAAPRMRGTAFEDEAHAKLHLAASLVLRRQPEPEEAARVALQVVAVPAAQRTDTARKRAGEVWKLLAEWRTVPAVQEFSDGLRSYQPAALPAPTT